MMYNKNVDILSNQVGPPVRGRQCFGRDQFVDLVWEKLSVGHVLLMAQPPAPVIHEHRYRAFVARGDHVEIAVSVEVAQRDFSWIAQDPGDPEIEQGRLESSNVPPAQAAVKLVSVMRQFEMLQKAVLLASQMNERTFSDVAKIPS